MLYLAFVMSLFENDADKIKELDKIVCEKMGYKESYKVSGQTYTRKLDSQVLNVLAGIAQNPEVLGIGIDEDIGAFVFE